MKHRRSLAAIAVLTTALLVAGCSSSSSKSASSSGSQKGGNLTILTQAATIKLDPAKSQNLAITSLGLIYRRLTTWQISPNSPGKVVPDLATNTGVASDGGKTWTYTLKSGLKFSNGTPITSADIKYGVERSFAPELSGGLSYHKSLLVGGATYTGPYTGGDLASIETPDAKTIVFHLNASYGDWPWIVSMPAFTPVPKADDNPATYGNDPVSSGPYQVVSYKAGATLNLKRNPYWSASTDSVRTAGPDTIVFKMNQATTTEAQTLIQDTGEGKTSFGADFVPAAQLVQAEQNPSVKSRLVTSQAGPLQYVAINTQSTTDGGALTNVKVRQALNYAIDRKAFILASGGTNAGVPATTLITPGIAGRQNFDLYPAGASGDDAKAKSILSDAGHGSDLNLTLLTQNDTTSLAQAQAVQQGLQQAGIKITLKPEDQDTFFNDVSGNTPDYDLAMMSWQPDFPSANSNIQPLFASSQIGNGGYNVSRYNSPAADALIDQATAEIDPSAAQALWVKADKLIMGDAAVVPLAYAKQSFLRGSSVGNFYVAAFPAYPNYLKVTVGS